MVFIHGATQSAAEYMCIDLRGGYIGVAEHGLHASQVSTAFQQMRGEAVADDMRR